MASHKKPSPAPDSPTIIKVRNFDFAYGNSQALFDINMDIQEKKVTAFIGPSGCGKSTFLRCFNRMNDLIDIARIKGGSVEINSVDIYNKDVDVIELRRHVGMVFQKSNPFPKSIYDNIAYGLRIQGIKKKNELDDVVEECLRGAALWDEVKAQLVEQRTENPCVAGSSPALATTSLLVFLYAHLRLEIIIFRFFI